MGRTLKLFNRFSRDHARFFRRDWGNERKVFKMIGRLWKWFWQPTMRYTWGAIFVVGSIAGIIFWGGFNTAMEATNTMGFCVSCHEMDENVYAEYKETVHYQNRTGVQATCSDCHKGEMADMGARIVGGDKAEATPIPGKRGHIEVAVQAAHDGENITFRLQWPDAGHTPVPFVDGGKMDPDNQIKVTAMFDDGKVEMGEQAGCWLTCHHDSRYMPDAPAQDALSASDAAKIIDVTDGVTKYTKGSRTKLEHKGRGGKKRGAWDKLIEKAKLDAQHAEGAFMDVLRFKSKDNKMENGFILADRQLKDAEKATGSGRLEGGVWTVTMTRPLAATQPGGVSFEPGKTYTVNFAIHDDYTSARFHHVSLEYRLALDNPEAEVNVVKK